MSGEAEIVSSGEGIASTQTDRPSVLGAALLSAFLPGAGQVILRRRSLAFALLIAEVSLLTSFLVLRLPRFYYAWIFLTVAWITLHITASWMALVDNSLSHRAASKAWLLMLIPLAVLAALFIWNRALILSRFRAYWVPSSSMEDTIYPGDRIMVDERAFRSRPPNRDELAILRKKAQLIVIKRVIAVPGDTIEGTDNKVFLNGHLLNEPFVKHSYPDSDSPIPSFNFVRIPKNEFFVMGDNRDVSLDSRSPEMGLVTASQLVGRPIYIVSSKHDDARRSLR